MAGEDEYFDIADPNPHEPRDIPTDVEKSRRVVLIGPHDNGFTRLGPHCPFDSCSFPGPDLEMALVLVRLAGYSPALYPLDKGNAPSRKFIANDMSFNLRDMGLRPPPNITYSLPLDTVSFGYVGVEDATLVVEMFLAPLIHWTTFLFIVFVALIRALREVFMRHKRGEPFHRPTLAHLRTFYLDLSDLNGIVKFKGSHVASVSLLDTANLFLVFYFGNVIVCWITSILADTMTRGYDVSKFGQALSLLESGERKVVLQENFRAEHYCSGDECRRWAEYERRHNSSIVRGRPLWADNSYLDMFTDRFTIGFHSIEANYGGSPVVYLSTRKKIVFVEDEKLTTMYMGYEMSRRNVRLIEFINRGIALTRTMHARIATRYTNPYSAYSRYTKPKKIDPLSLGRLRQLFFFFTAIQLLAIVLCVAENIYHKV